MTVTPAKRQKHHVENFPAYVGDGDIEIARRPVPLPQIVSSYGIAESPGQNIDLSTAFEELVQCQRAPIAIDRGENSISDRF